jgi:hypothetical protein
MSLQQLVRRQGLSIAQVHSSPIDNDAAAADILSDFERIGREALDFSGLDATDLSGISFSMPNPFDAAPLIGAAVFWSQVSSASDFSCESTATVWNEELAR